MHLYQRYLGMKLTNLEKEAETKENLVLQQVVHVVLVGLTVLQVNMAADCKVLQM